MKIKYKKELINVIGKKCVEKVLIAEVFESISQEGQKRCSMFCWLRHRQGGQQGPRAADTLMMGTNHTPTQNTNTDSHTKVLKPLLRPSPSLVGQTRGPSECHTHMPYTMNSPSLPDSLCDCVPASTGRLLPARHITNQAADSIIHWGTQAQSLGLSSMGIWLLHGVACSIQL